MYVFELQLFGADADWFVAQCKKDQKKWIKENSKVQDDAMIDAYLETVNRGKDECDDCKKASPKQQAPKEPKNAKPETVPTEVKPSPEPDETS